MKIITLVPCYNEGRIIYQVLTAFPKGVTDEIVVVNDGSTDESPAQIQAAINRRKDLKITVLNHKSKMGAGCVVRDAIDYAIKQKYEIFTLMAGNGKDNPQELNRLIQPIVKDDYDYVQGSRFIQGGSFKNLPKKRLLLIKAFTWLFYLITTNGRFFGTDATNGFRGYKLNIFKNPKINIYQEWLDTYGLEIYLHYKIFSEKLRFIEVPVSKDYPFSKNYSKIRPFLDWFSIFKPVILLKLHLKQ